MSINKLGLRLFLFIAIINSSLAQIPNTITETEKLYGLSKFWQEVNYNFVYLDRRDREKKETLYLEIIQSIQNIKNDYEY